MSGYDPLRSLVSMSPPMMDLNLPPTPAQQNYASEFYKRLVSWISDFEKELDGDHEVAVRLVSFGQALSFHLQDMSYWNPSLIRFDGVTSEGQTVQLIQHVSQISVLLMRAEKLGGKANRVGFKLDESADE